MESIRPMRLPVRIFTPLVLFPLLTTLFKEYAEAQTAVTLQEMLNNKCRAVYEHLCSNGDRKFCRSDLNPAVRKGLGGPGQNSPEYRCYANNAVTGDKVDFSANGLWCLDDCGNDVRCPGTVKRQQGSFHTTRHKEIAEWIEQGKLQHCSSLQRKLDAQCVLKVPNSVGRIVDNTPNGEMVCASTEALDFLEDAFCFNQCGTPSPCPGKPSGNVVRLPADTKAMLMRDFTRPCTPSQRCVQPRGMPLQCEEGKGPETGVLIGDGKEIQVEFSSPRVTITAETCLRAELDLDRRTMRIGRNPENLTPIQLPIVRPPYTVSLRSTGNGLQMKLAYRTDVLEFNTLYYAQLESSCLEKERVTFTGLDEGAQLSHKSESSISSVTK